jgi:hypothetical protein
VLNEELLPTAPTVYLTTSDPEAPELPAVPPEPFPLLLLLHSVDTVPQLAPVALTVLKLAAPP